MAVTYPPVRSTLAAAADPSAPLGDRLLDHSATVAGRYVGRVESWDVTNEPLAFSSGRFDTASPYSRSLGAGYAAHAFRAADASARGSS